MSVTVRTVDPAAPDSLSLVPAHPDDLVRSLLRVYSDVKNGWATYGDVNARFRDYYDLLWFSEAGFDDRYPDTLMFTVSSTDAQLGANRAVTDTLTLTVASPDDVS